MISRHKNLILILLSLCTFVAGYGQEDEEEEYAGDPLYREDQFYIGAGYNLATEVPSGFNISGLSGGIQLGFLRDMPVNERRNVAVAIGAGLTYDHYGQNLAITEQNGSTSFDILGSDVTFNSNRLTLAGVEVPVEFRWRSSTPSSYRFWRIYTGVRFGYIYYFNSKLKQSGDNVVLTSLPELDRFQMGISLSVGYNTVNFYGYYSVTPLFSDATTSGGENVGFKTLKLGLIFYIL